jgi:hypothetical protein
MRPVHRTKPFPDAGSPRAAKRQTAIRMESQKFCILHFAILQVPRVNFRRLPHRRISSTRRPSRREMVRPQLSATFMSCVTMTTVVPSRECRSRRSPRISSPVRVSRFPVGSSARMTGGIDGQGPRNRDALPFPARELLREVRQARAELYETQQLPGALVHLAPRPPAQVQREPDVLHAGERGQQVEELEDEADLVAPHARQLVVREPAERLVVHADLPRRGAVEPSDQVEERGLAGSGRADDRGHLTPADRQAHIVEGRDVALAIEALGDVLDLDHGRTAGRGLIAGAAPGA